MKIQNTILTKKNDQAPVPVFHITDKDHESSETPDPLEVPLSFFDIKELYDRAYTAKNEGRNDHKAKEMMAEAIKMDMAYRCQLSRQSKYIKPSKMNDFRIITNTA